MARRDPAGLPAGAGEDGGAAERPSPEGCAGTAVGDPRLEWRPVKSPPKTHPRVLFLGLEMGRPPCWVKPVLGCLILRSSVFMHNR